MAEFTYNNAKNASTRHTPFELNCGFYSRISYKKDVDPHFKSKLEDELSAELRELMIICTENLYYAQKLQKRAHDKGVKPRSYVSDDKVWLNTKYIKTKKNKKLEAKFFRPFQILHHVGKQVYKIELPKKLRIHDVFYVSLLERNTRKKEWVDENGTTELIVLNEDDYDEYKVEAICNSAVYARESESGQIPRLYYLISWKGYPEEENIWEPVAAMQYLRKLISPFYKDYSDKPIATFEAINTAPPMAKLIIKPKTTGPPKRKRGWQANTKKKKGPPVKSNKQAKN